MKARESMASIDFHYLARELERLKGRRIKKVYQISQGVFSLTIWPDLDGRRELILASRRCVFLSKKEWPKPKYPSALAMGLRKRLGNARIVNIEQPDMERILIFEFEGEYSSKLIVELFGKGNLILTDEEGTILQVARSIKVKDRTLRRYEKYRLPPRLLEVPSILEIDKHKLPVIMKGCKHLELWRFLLGMGVGPPYIDEVLLKAELSANVKVGSLLGDKLSILSEALLWLAKRLKEKPEPIIYLSDGSMVNFSAFPLESLAKELEPKPINCFMDLLEEYFSPLITKETSDKELLELERRVKALEMELQHQKELLMGYEREISDLKSKGEILFSHLYEAQSLIEMARKGIQDDRIINVDRSRQIATIVIDGITIDVDLKKTASENASGYYDRAKKLTVKINRGKEMLKELESRISSMRTEAEIMQISKKPKIRRKKRWFERFRWFLSTEGFLVVAGRDRSTNRELVRRYMERDDLFFHVEQPGGAVVIVKTERRPVGEKTIAQAADYAACFSRAWREGLSYADVYYVKGKQVLSHAPPGMYIPKGSFYISGRRNYLKGRLELAIGVLELNGELKLTSFPLEASDRMKTKVQIVPGEVEKLEAAKIIKEVLEEKLKKVTTMSLYLDLDEILKALPSGRFRILKR